MRSSNLCAREILGQYKPFGVLVTGLSHSCKGVWFIPTCAAHYWGGSRRDFKYESSCHIHVTVWYKLQVFLKYVTAGILNCWILFRFKKLEIVVYINCTANPNWCYTWISNSLLCVFYWHVLNDTTRFLIQDRAYHRYDQHFYSMSYKPKPVLIPWFIDPRNTFVFEARTKQCCGFFTSFNSRR